MNSDFKVVRAGDLYRVKCRVCFVVSDSGASKRRPHASFKYAYEVREWIDGHDHTPWRTECEAEGERKRVWGNVHPEGSPFTRTMALAEKWRAEKRLAMDEVERIAEFNLRERKCFLCGDDPVKVQTRNSPRGRGIEVVVLCAAHVASGGMWSVAEQNDAARIPV